MYRMPVKKATAKQTELIHSWRGPKMTNEQLQQKICAAICHGNGLKAREIAKLLNLDRNTVNHVLFTSHLLRDLCYQDDDYRWHGLIKQTVPHSGLWDYSGYYGTVAEFLGLTEEEWLERLKEGCERIGRSLNDKRGLFNSFRNCREQMVGVFNSLLDWADPSCLDWEIVFEFKMKRARRIRIYADVLVITEDKIFTLEFKMAKEVYAADVVQAAKYVPYLEIVFGPNYDVIPALVVTRAKNHFLFYEIEGRDGILPACSGDRLYDVFDEYLDLYE